MQRLFVAIDLPDKVKTQIKSLCSGIPNTKWVGDQQLHLTLRFIGDADTAQQELIETGLATIRANPFDLALQGVGQFPLRGQPRILWVGIQTTIGLMELQKQVESVIQKNGFNSDKQTFSPHITLTRFRTPPPFGWMETYFKTHIDFKSELFRVDRFILYASQLTSQETLYRPEAQFPLG